MVEKRVYVSNETASQWQGVGEWATYCAVLLDEDGKGVFEDFIVQLYLETRVVACVYLRRNIYDPETGDLCIAFQVPKEFTPGTYRMYLYWHTQMNPTTLITYLEGESPGIDYKIVPSCSVMVSKQTILHAQAPGQWTSFKCKILDEFGNPLPESFYLQLFCHSDLPAHVKISEFIGFTNGFNRKFYTSYKPIDAKFGVKVYIDGSEVSPANYTVDYANGVIEFLSAPPKGTSCPGSSITADYVAFTSGDFPLGGVSLVDSRKTGGVYNVMTGELQFAFRVPEDFSGGMYPVWLRWGGQVIGETKFVEGEGSKKFLIVTTDVRKVVITDEWVELLHLYPGQETSYHALVYDERGEALPETVPAELLLNGVVVARAFLAPDVYNPVTKEVKLAFKVPDNTPGGEHTVKLKCYEYVTGGEL